MPAKTRHITFSTEPLRIRPPHRLILAPPAGVRSLVYASTPGVAENAPHRANFHSALRAHAEGVQETLAPGGAFCATPGVKFRSKKCTPEGGARIFSRHYSRIRFLPGSLP